MLNNMVEAHPFHEHEFILLVVSLLVLFPYCLHVCGQENWAGQPGNEAAKHHGNI